MTSIEIVLIVVGTLMVLSVGFVLLLPWIFQPIIRVILSPRYGFRIQGRHNIPRQGPVILAANHVTWIDALFLAASCPRNGHVLANADFFKSKLLYYLAHRAGMIPVPFTGPKAQRAAIAAVREALDCGELVAIFPEGQLTRNGMLGPFYRGLEVILKGRPEVAVVPVYLDNLWGSIWSFKGWRAFGKWPVGWRRVVNVVFGPPLTGVPSLFQVRIAILETGVEAVGARKRPPSPLETIDLALPRLDHPTLGLLTGSAPNYDRDGAVQPGHREGTVGLPVPGVAIRVLGDTDQVLPETEVGRVQARCLGYPCWTEIGVKGHLDRDGFLTIDAAPQAH